MSSTDCDTKNVLQNTVDDEEDVPIVPKRPHIYDGDYFEIVSREKDAIIVRCRMCGPEGALLRAALTSSSNILKHVKRKHPDQMNKLKTEKKIKSRTPRSEVRLRYLNAGQMKKENVDKAYLAAKAKRQLVVDEHNDGDSEVGEVHDMNVDDQDPVFEFAYDDKIDERSIELINFEDEAIDSPVRTHHKSTATLQLHTANKELLEMQKTLLEREYNDLYAFRLERHQLEMSILKAELAHKTMEHQKRMDILNKKLQHT